jgi:hypothetical protein
MGASRKMSDVERARVTKTERRFRRFLGHLVAWTGPVAIVLILFFAVLATESPMFRTAIPHEPLRAICNWACHNGGGCHHADLLPKGLVGDAGIFGATIRGLYALGRWFSPDAFTGYQMANLFVFCFAWPLLMYLLLVRATFVRFRIRSLRHHLRWSAGKS